MENLTSGPGMSGTEPGGKKCLGGIHPRRFSGLLPLAPSRRHALSLAHNSWFTGLSNVFIYKLLMWQTQPLVLLPGMCPHSLTLCDVPAADISTVIVDKPQKAALLLEHVERKETPGLKLIILMEPFEEALKDRGQECGVVVKSMQAVEVRVCFRVGGLLGRSKLATEPELLLICLFYGSGWMSWAIRVCQG